MIARPQSSTRTDTLFPYTTLFRSSGNRSDGWLEMGRSRNLSLSGALRLDVSPECSLTLSLAQGWQKPQRYFGMPLINGQPDDALRKKNYNVGDASIDYQDQWAELSALWTPNDTTTVQSRLYHIESKRHWRNDIGRASCRERVWQYV